MPRPRVPTKKAAVSGAAVVNPARFAGRSSPKASRPLGAPYANMTIEQKAAWAEFEADMPWLTSAHRTLVRLACYQAARLHAGEDLGVAATQALSAILSKLGATPVDESKVNHDPGEPEDPDDRFFTRPH